MQELLVEALRQPDPRQFLQDAVPAEVELTEQERRWLLAIDGDGLLLSRMLVRKLRMQRIVRGDAQAAAQMAQDPAAFAARFVSYDREEPLHHVFPREESAAFMDHRSTSEQ